MAEASQSYETSEPRYTADDTWDKKKEVLRVSVIIPGLEVTKKMVKSSKSIIPKRVTVVDNVLEPQINFKTQSFTVTVTGKDTGALKGKQFYLNIRQLHKPILPEASHWEPKEGRLLLYLKKQESGSWYPELEEGLDAYESDNDEKSADADEDNAANTKEKEEKMEVEETSTTGAASNTKPDEETGEQ